MSTVHYDGNPAYRFYCPTCSDLFKSLDGFGIIKKKKDLAGLGLSRLVQTCPDLNGFPRLCDYASLNLLAPSAFTKITGE